MSSATDAVSPTQLTAPSRVLQVLGNYVALTKPRIIELLLVTTVPVMMLAAHGLPRIGLVVLTLLGGTLAAGSANALNCYLDRDIDAVMARTRARPLTHERVKPRHALVFGVALVIFSLKLRSRQHERVSPTAVGTAA